MTKKKVNNDSVGLVWRQMTFSSMVTARQAAACMEHLASSTEIGMVALELRAGGDSPLRWYLSARPTHLGSAEAILRTHLPIHLHPQKRVRNEPDQAAQVILRGQPPHLAADRIEDATRNLFGVLAGLGSNDELVVQLLLGRRFSPTVPDRDAWRIHVETLLFGEKPPGTRARPSASSRQRIDQHGFAATVRIAASTATVGRTQQLIRRVRSALKVLEPSRTRIGLKPIPSAAVTAAKRPWSWPLRLTSGEAAALAGWPTGSGQLPVFGAGHPQLIPPSGVLTATTRTLGVSAAPGFEDHRIGIPIHDAASHTHILGPTNVGKSTTLLNLLRADITAGHSVVLVDPKGDLADDALTQIPKNRIQDVVVLDAANHARAVGFNPLTGHPEDAAQTADMLLTVFESMDDRAWGSQIRQTFTTAVHTLTRVPGANLLWLMPLLTDSAFRRRILKQATDDTGLELWQQFDAMSPEQQSLAIMPVIRRLHPILMRKSLRGILGQSTPTFDLQDVFTGRKILIVNLNKGRLGAEPARMLGNLLIGLLWQHTLKRQQLTSGRRHIVSLVIDEAHAFLGSLGADLTDVLSMARSLGLGLTLSHQHLAQLSTPMQAAVAANTRNKVMFQLGARDAHTIAKTTTELEAQDFQLLPTHHAQVQLMQQGRQTRWMSVKLDGPPSVLSDPAEIYAASQQRYARDLSDVDAEYRRLTQEAPRPGPPSTPDTPIGRRRS